MTNLNLKCNWKLVMLPWQLNEIKCLSIKITKINNIKNKPIKVTWAHNKITTIKTKIKNPENKIHLIHINKYYTNKTKISRVTTAVVHYIKCQHFPLRTNKQKADSINFTLFYQFKPNKCLFVKCFAFLCLFAFAFYSK